MTSLPMFLRGESPELQGSFERQYPASSLLLSPDNARPIKCESDCDEYELTFSNRAYRPPTVPPLKTHSRDSSFVAISSRQHNNSINISQDVREAVNTSAAFPSSSLATRSNGSPSGSTLPHVSLNNQSTRPRTSKVFESTSDLAAHYGIPQILPPAPRTTPHRSRTPSSSTHSQSPTLPDFLSLKANYINMLSQKPTDNSTMVVDNPSQAVSVEELSTPVLPPTPEQQVQSIIEDILASPEFRNAQSFESDFLTSPLLGTPFDTPYDDFTASPNDDSPFADFLATPLIPDNDFGLGEYDQTMSLFGGVSIYDSLPQEKVTSPVIAAPSVAAPVSDSSPTQSPPLLDPSKMYTISPSTPMLDSLDPSSLYPSPRIPTEPVFTPPPVTRRKSAATGTRKNITPGSLVPLDAPTQPRKYVLPSATSRKEVPAVFARKRTRGAAFGDGEEDELEPEPLAPNATEREQIEWKRRQNTLAARKSRKRKLEHQQYLETRVEELEGEVRLWKTRTEMLAQILRSHGVPFEPFDDN